MKDYSLEKVMELAGGIDGWLSEDEGIFLYNAAKRVSKNHAIVEIGSWKGKSTVWLGSGSMAGNRAKVYAIDPHKDADGAWPVLLGRSRPPTLLEFRRNIRAAGLSDIVAPIVNTSEGAHGKWDGKAGPAIGLLWIDALHDYEDVRRDFLLWSPHLVDGGTIAFHDTTAEGPRRVAEKYVFNSNQFKNAGFADSIVFATKTNKNSFADRLRNNCVLCVKNSYEFLTRFPLPARLRSFGRRIFRTLQR